MPALTWIRKDKVITYHLKVPYWMLEHSYELVKGEQVSNKTKSDNKIIYGYNCSNLFNPAYANINTGCVSLTIEGEYIKEILPLWPDRLRGCRAWRKVLIKKVNHLLFAMDVKSNWKRYRKCYAISIEGEGVTKKIFATWHNSMFFKEMVQTSFGFIFSGLRKIDFPQTKSIDLIKKTIGCCKESENIIPDLFAGSGTTAPAVIKRFK